MDSQSILSFERGSVHLQALEDLGMIDGMKSSSSSPESVLFQAIYPRDFHSSPKQHESMFLSRLLFLLHMNKFIVKKRDNRGEYLHSIAHALIMNGEILFRNESQSNVERIWNWLLTGSENEVAKFAHSPAGSAEILNYTFKKQYNVCTEDFTDVDLYEERTTHRYLFNRFLSLTYLSHQHYVSFNIALSSANKLSICMLKPNFQKSTSSGFFLTLEAKTTSTIKDSQEGRLISYYATDDYFRGVQEMYNYFLEIEEKSKRDVIIWMLSSRHLGKDKLKPYIEGIPPAFRIYKEVEKGDFDENSPLLSK
jgi:hypothetical protein